MSTADDFALELVGCLGLGERDYSYRTAGVVKESAYLAMLASAVFDHMSVPPALLTNIRLMDGDKQIDREHWSTSRIGEGNVIHSQLDAPMVDAAVAAGKLLAIDSIDEYQFDLMRLREALEYLLSARAWVNVYLTGTSESNFGPHFDDQHTVILQLVGRKRWVVSDRPRSTDGADFMAAAEEIELVPGSALCVPAGTGHDVLGCGELSMHLTIGFDPDAWLPEHLAAAEQAIGRTTIPPSWDEIELGKALLLDRRAGSSLPFRWSQVPRDCALVRWASRLPPFVRELGSGGIRVTSLGQSLVVQGGEADMVRCLASGRELDLAALVEASGFAQLDVVRSLWSLASGGWVICRRSAQ